MSKNNYIKAFMKMGEVKKKVDEATSSPLFDYCDSKHQVEFFIKKFQDDPYILHSQLRFLLEELNDIGGMIYSISEDSE